MFATTVVPACRFSRLCALGEKWNESRHRNFPVESLLVFFPARERHRTIGYAIVKESPDLLRIAFGGRGQRKPDSVNTLADIRPNPTRIGGHDRQAKSRGLAKDYSCAFGAGWEYQEMRCFQKLGEFTLSLWCALADETALRNKVQLFTRNAAAGDDQFRWEALLVQQTGCLCRDRSAFSLPINAKEEELQPVLRTGTNRGFDFGAIVIDLEIWTKRKDG